MTIDDNLIESLLYEGEGVELDLKSDQYRFPKASDDEKSELLKDILAFANAWRRSDAFILIGVQEVKGGRSQVLGISDLLDDAAVQQFVNSKTNRPVIFSYRTLSFEGKKIAIIHIPIQQRPIYLKKDFGKLKGETVYVKRGSSTAIASIDEIAKMGLQPLLEYGEPDLEVFFADPKTRSRLPNEIELKSLVLETPGSSAIPDYSRRQQDPFDIRTSRPNYSYYRELVEYTKVSRLVFPLHVAVGNAGSATAHDVRLEMKVDKSAGNVIIMDSYGYPDIPRQEYNVFDLSPRVTNATTGYDVEVDDVGNFWIVEARAHKVQPKGIHWFRDPFYVGSLVSCNISIAVTIFSDQLQIPQQKQLFVKVQSEQRKADLEGIKQLERERILASPEYQPLIQMQKRNKEE